MLFDRASVVFLIWSTVGGMVMAAGITSTSFNGLPPALHTAVAIILLWADALWICLAAALVWRHEARISGTVSAAWVMLAIAIISGASEWLGATTGILFGHYIYSDQFGWRLGGVLPFTIPLAWYAVVVGACRVLDMTIRCAQAVRPVLAGLLATLTDFNLEPVAIYVRGYWQWFDPATCTTLGKSPPLNYLSWFVLASALALLVPRAQAGGANATRPAGLSPAQVLVVMNLLFVMAHIGRICRN